MHPGPGRHPWIYDVLAGRTDRALPDDIMDANETMACYPDGTLKCLVAQLRNFSAYAVERMPPNIIELGAGLPGHIPVATGRTIVYVDDESGLTVEAKRWLTSPREHFIDANFWNAKGIMQRCKPFFSSGSVGIVFVGLADFMDDESVERFARDWYQAVPPGSTLAMTFLINPQLDTTLARPTQAGEVVQKHVRLTRKAGNTMYVRPHNGIIEKRMRSWQKFLLKPTYIELLPGAEVAPAQEKIGHFTGWIVQK